MNAKENIKFVIVVRKDLDMGCGKIAAQVGHACSTVVYNHFNYIFNWINYGNQKKAVLKVQSENELINLIKKAKEKETHGQLKPVFGEFLSVRDVKKLISMFS